MRSSRLGRELVKSVKGRPTGRPLRLVVGVADGVPKLIASHLLKPALRMSEPVRLVVQEQSTTKLLAALAVQELLAQLKQPDVRLSLKERCAQALGGESSAIPEVNRKRAELEAAMSAVERLIRKTFLGDGGAGGARSPKTSGGAPSRDRRAGPGRA
jgi:hypothetical protein